MAPPLPAAGLARAAAVGCLLLLALAARPRPAAARPSPARAADEAPLTLAVVACRGLVTLPCATIEHHLGLPRGGELAAAALDRALRRLWATGLVDDVSLVVEPAAPGTGRLVVTVAERPMLDALRLVGVDRLTRTRVDGWLAARGGGPPVDEPLDRAALETLRADLERRLAADGRPARVVTRLRPTTAGRVAAEIELAPGPRGPLVDEIVFDGARRIAPGALRRVMSRNQRASPGVRLAGRGRLDRDGLEDDRRAVVRLYRSRGFKDVVVEPARVETDEEGLRCRLVFTVREGNRWLLGELSVSGNRAFGDQRLLALLERRDGVFDQPAIDHWVEQIRRLYAGLGRLDTRVAQRRRERAGGRVDVMVTVSEGPMLALGKLTVSGNTRTASTVLRRELGVDEGQALDLGAVERGLARLRERGLFEPAADALSLERRGVDSGRVDLTLSGREADPYRIDLGGGWSRSDGLAGHLTLEARNVAGRGVAAGLSIVESESRDRLELYVVEPRFRGRRQTVSGELFGHGRRLTPAAGQVLARDQRGLRLAWSRAAGAAGAVRLGLTRSRLDDRRSVAAGAASAVRFERTTVDATWTWDRRDRILRPRHGLRAGLSLAVSSDHGVGGRQLLRPGAQLALYRPLGSSVVALRLAAGLVETSGSADGAPLDGVFLGGPGSVRGFAAGALGARDADGAPLLDAAGFRRGGDRFLEAGVELRFPLVGPLSGVVFVDAGETWVSGRTSLGDQPRAATGIELWLQPRGLPLPVRLTWAHDLDPLPDQEFDRFLLGLGASF